MISQLLMYGTRLDKSHYLGIIAGKKQHILGMFHEIGVIVWKINELGYLLHPVRH